jgi:ABC-type branched-subunit amino acid transport system ATPase component
VNLQVQPGEIMTIIGHNGAGKSTLLRAIFNLVPSRTGRIVLGERDVSALPSDRLLMAGVAYIPQHRSVFPRLTIEENLQMGGYLVRDKALLAQRIDRVLNLFPILKTRAGQLAGMMSGGEQRMLEIARTLLQEPQLIMLDEPSIGLSPKMVDAVFDNVRLLREQGKAILMVEQNVRKALSISDRGGVMELGSLRMQDQAARLIGDERVARLYLGRR